jgi:hypothetical protein
MLHMYKNDSFECKWIHHIESSLNNLGLGYIWVNQGCNVNCWWLKNTVSQCLSDQFSQEWKSNVDIASSCINYRLFKNELSYEI